MVIHVDLLKTFLSMPSNSDLAKKNLFLQHTEATQEEICEEYHREPQYHRPRVPQIWRPILVFKDTDISLVTQLTADRYAHILCT